MGQIVQKASNPVRCNLAAIQAGGSQANVVLDDGEVWFVDTTNAEKGTDGYGHYDAYIVGDGVTMAYELEVRPIDDMSAFATKQELAAKQDVINDLATIRSGAQKGNTAYQKPNSGIPKSDLASAVQTSLGKADAAALQSTTYTKTEVDAALAAKQDSAQMATINGSRIDQGGNVTIVAAEGQTITIDAVPTEGSNNAVSSGGVHNSVISSGVFDLSAYNSGTTYADLTAALTAMNSLSPAYKIGGMAIRFIQSSDNKYVQYFLTKDGWSASEDDWEKMNLEEEVTDLTGKVEIYNGSNGNPGNTNLVRTKVVDTRGAKQVIARITRPNATGCHYSYGYALTSSTSDIGSTDQYSRWNGGLVKVDASDVTTDWVIDISSYPATVGIAITIGEYNGTTVQTLRSSDFSAFDVFLVREPSVEEIVSQEIEKEKEQESVLLSDSLYGTQLEQKVIFEHGLILFGTSGWSYANSQSNIRTPQNFKLHLYPGDVIGLTDYSVGIKISFSLRYVNGEYYTVLQPTSDYIIQGECDAAINVRYSNSSHVYYVSDISKYVKVIRNNTICDDVTRCYVAGGIARISNGSNGNLNNANFVHTDVIRTNGAKYAILKVSRPNLAGYHYAFGYAITEAESDIGTPQQTSTWDGLLYKADVSNTYTNYIIDLSSYPTAVGISFTIAEYNASNVVNPLRISDFDRYSVQIICDPAMENFLQSQIEEQMSGGVVERNAERKIALEAICRYRKFSAMPQKDMEMLICTDSHYDELSVDNAIKATNGFGVIDCFIHCGDIMPSYYTPSCVNDFKAQLNSLTKAGYIVIGNHDVGNAYYVGYCCNHTQAYDAYIKPMVDKGWLAPGEYTANKPYWHHDLTDYKIRLIGLYEYDDNLDLNETYWKPITYNSGLSNIVLNTAYSVGAQVNVSGYTAYSFEAVQAVTTPASYYTTPEKFPSYKVRRGDRVIRQEQAQWFLDTLAATPANYGVVVILHNPFSDLATTIESKFNQFRGSSQVTGASYSQNDMATDLINDALVAFAAGSTYTANVAMKGDAAYMNMQGGNTYAYTVSKDFSQKNSGVKIFGLLGGHSHRDLVWKLGNLIQITPVCATTNIANATGSDIQREGNDGLTKDSLTVVSFASGRIGLAKIGVNVTEDGYSRDYEVIKTS